MDHNHIIADIDENTLSTGTYDHLFKTWLEQFKNAAGELKLSENEYRSAAFYAGMKAAHKLLYEKETTDE
jgi:hypothetical protein